MRAHVFINKMLVTKKHPRGMVIIPKWVVYEPWLPAMLLALRVPWLQITASHEVDVLQV